MFNDFTPGFLDRVRIRQDDATNMILDQGVRDMFERRILNADETLFTARETQQIKRIAYETLYPEMMADKLVPVDTEGDTGSDSLGWDTFDFHGKAQIGVDDKANDFPEADISKEQKHGPVRTIGSSTSWSLQDIRRATLAASRSGISSNYSFTKFKTEAAVQIIKLAEEDIIAQGDAKTGLVGFFNNALIPAVTLKGNTTAWGASGSTPTDVLADLNLMVNQVIINSKARIQPNTILMDLNPYTYISSTPFTGNNGTATETILSFFLTKAQADKTDLKIIPYARIAGGVKSGEGTIVLSYKREPRVLQQQIPQPLEVFGPFAEKNGLVFKVIMRERHGGVHLRYPVGAARGVMKAVS